MVFEAIIFRNGEHILVEAVDDSMRHQIGGARLEDVFFSLFPALKQGQAVRVSLIGQDAPLPKGAVALDLKGIQATGADAPIL